MAASGKGKKPSRKRKTETRPGTPWRPRTWIGLTVIISVWMFIFGILVGRGTVPSQFDFDKTKRDLYAQAKQADQSTRQVGIAEESIKASSQGDVEKSKKAGRVSAVKTDHSGQQTPSIKKKKVPPEPVKKIKKKKPARKPPKKNHPAKKDHPVKTAVSPQVKTRTGASTTPPPPKKRRQKPKVFSYQIIQVAAMKDLSSARKMVAQLRKKGYPAYLASSVVSGRGVIHRVRMGPYRSDLKAKKTLGRLKKQGINGRILKGR